MNHGIIWCATCRQPQPLGTKVCPGCARPFDRALHKQPHHPLEGTKLGEKWLLRRLIGSGGAGEVFDAEDIVLHRAVAVKIMRATSAEAGRRLEREALLVAAARHPNICDVYDIGSTPSGHRFVVLERLYGEPLAAVIRTAHTTMPLLRIIDIFTQLLSAIHAAHGAKIVHRDLSPKNVFLVDRLDLPPVVKVLDFGLARDASGVRSTLRPAMTRVRIGTIAYMSPEQIVGEDLDRRSDIFSIGVLLYEMLTGRHPFAGPSFEEFEKRLVTKDPTAIASLRSDVPAALAQVVSRALAKAPAQRYQDALGMQRDLLAVTEPKRQAARTF